MTYAIAQLNAMDQSAFVEALGFVFEDTPEIAAQTWRDRPFSDASDLHQKMLKILNAMTADQKLALIQAHPDLGTKAKMAEASVKEQSGAGLDQLSPEEFERFASLNQQYRDRFSFPFIIAVKNHTKTTILEAFEERLENSAEAEMERAIAEIAQIAWFRIQDAIAQS